MTRHWAFEGLLLLAGFGPGTWVLGWWLVPLGALGWGLIGAGSSRPWLGAVAAAGGWGALLLVNATSGALGRLLDRVGGVLHLPGWALIVATLSFPALLAWSGIRLGRGVRGRTPGPA